MHETDAAAKRPHVVVIGGGFGGLAAVRRLKDADVDITLIDRHTYNTFQPLLYQVATAALNPGDVTWFLRAVRSNQENVRFVRGTVLSMDHEDRSIVLDGNIVVKYDYLVIATGVTANFFGIPGAKEYSMPLYRRSQALRLRDKIFAEFEDSAMNDQDRDLRIVVAALRVSASLERMGDIAEHIAQLTRMRFPERAIPKGLKGTFTKMGELDVEVAKTLTELLRTEDLSYLETLRTLDDKVDDHHLAVFEKVLSENWQGEAGATVDATLASRYLERFADHAVSVAKKVAYLATGDWTPDTVIIAEGESVDGTE